MGPHQIIADLEKVESGLEGVGLPGLPEFTRIRLALEAIKTIKEKIATCDSQISATGVLKKLERIRSYFAGDRDNGSHDGWVEYRSSPIEVRIVRTVLELDALIADLESLAK